MTKVSSLVLLRRKDDRILMLRISQESSTPASDVYSLGLVFLKVLARTLPKRQDEREKLASDLTRSRPDRRLNLAAALALRCISYDPRNRPTAATLSMSLLLEKDLMVIVYMHVHVYVCICMYGICIHI